MGPIIMNKIGSKKVALIIGSSGGIGSACALSLAHSGYEVALHYNKNRHHLSDLQARIVKEGRQAILVKAELRPNAGIKGESGFFGVYRNIKKIIGHIR